MNERPRNLRFGLSRLPIQWIDNFEIYKVNGMNTQSLKQAKTISKSYVLKELSAALLIVLFLYTAITKALDFTNFSHVIDQSYILKGYGKFIAVFIPLFEIIIAICLFLPFKRRLGFFLSIFILTVFTGYIIYMLLTASKLPCHCGGVIDRMTWKQHIFFNLFFLLISFYGFFRTTK